jgi:hypothetical protein
MAKRRKGSKAKRSKAKRRAKKGTSSLARFAAKRGMTIKQLKKAVPSCGKWSVRRRKGAGKTCR